MATLRRYACLPEGILLFHCYFILYTLLWSANIAIGNSLPIDGISSPSPRLPARGLIDPYRPPKVIPRYFSQWFFTIVALPVSHCHPIVHGPPFWREPSGSRTSTPGDLLFHDMLLYQRIVCYFIAISSWYIVFLVPSGQVAIQNRLLTVSPPLLPLEPSRFAFAPSSRRGPLLELNLPARDFDPGWFTDSEWWLSIVCYFTSMSYCHLVSGLVKWRSC